MSREDGSPITDETIYLKQSIYDLINTTVGSRVMRRNYGTNIMDFIDAPINELMLIRIQAYLASIILFQEKNILLKKLYIQQKLATLSIIIEGNFIPSGNAVNSLDIQLQNFKKT